MEITPLRPDLNQESDQKRWVDTEDPESKNCCNLCCPWGKVRPQHFYIGGGILLTSVALVVIHGLVVWPYAESCTKMGEIFIKSCNRAFPTSEGCSDLTASCLDLCLRAEDECRKFHPFFISLFIGFCGASTSSFCLIFIACKTSCACIGKIRNCCSEYKEIPDSAAQNKNDL